MEQSNDEQRYPNVGHETNLNFQSADVSNILSSTEFYIASACNGYSFSLGVIINENNQNTCSRFTPRKRWALRPEGERPTILENT